MDLSEVEQRAKELLAGASRFSGAVDTYSIVTLSYNQDASWQGDPARLRLNMRAFNLLLRMRLLNTIPDMGTFELSDMGRQIANSGWPTDWSAEWLDEWVETEQLLETLSMERTSSENGISKLVVKNWRQFSSVDVIFHPRLTILTGANGAGKTTLLNILGPHFNWTAQLLTRRGSESMGAGHQDVGELMYTNGARSPIYQSSGSGVNNTPLSLPQMQSVPGLFINSHRSISTYQPLAALPPRFSEWSSLQQQFAAEIQIRYSGGSSQHSPLHRMKEALVAAAMFAYGNQAIRANGSAREVWEGYQEVLRRFLPSSLQFERLAVEDAEIILVTRAAEFPLEAASGGISAMLELSWQIFLRQRNEPSFTVCIDEPENHLHPELQRSIVPSLLAGFPNVTFIIATHSPFVVTSTPDSFVYALGADDNGRISSRRVDNLNASATPDETLMSVLGLDSALPLWAESRLNELMTDLPASPSAAQLRDLRDDLRGLGLDRQFPAAIRALGPRL